MENQAPQLGDADIAKILSETKTIAMIGASTNSARPSYGVMRYLLEAGYLVIPINPKNDGQEIHGQKVYGSLGDVPGNIDLVDVFRRTDAIPEVVDEIIPLVEEKSIRCLWMQLGISHREAASRAAGAGLTVVMDRCIKIEHGRLLT